MSNWKKYHIAYSVKDALQALQSAAGPAMPVGGGTDLLLEIQQGSHDPINTLVDITHIEELTKLEIRGDNLFIGAAVPVRKVAESPLIYQHAAAVSEACGLIGGPQVRNTATIGGNVAHALPAADGMIALVALDAQAEIATAEDRRLVPILTLFKGPGKSTLDPQKELLCGFYLSLRSSNQGSAFSRIMRPQGVALPILNMALWLEISDQMISKARLAIGPSGPTPSRAAAVEDFLHGKRFSNELSEQAHKIICETVRFRSSPQRASAEYRYEISRPLFADVLSKAWHRANLVEVE